MTLRRVRTADLQPVEVEAVRALLAGAWPEGDFDEMDWQHATGGVHVILEMRGRILAHAAVVERDLVVGDVALRAGYVEAVATLPEQRGRGLGSAVMGSVNAVIGDAYDLGALSTGAHRFYERLGWLRWRGPSWVRTADALVRTEEDDEGIMVLRTPRSPDQHLDWPIVCEWRAGDFW